MKLKGKVAIVTGGANGIGAAYCKGLAKEGCKVVVADIIEDDAIEYGNKLKTMGYDAFGIKVDVTSEEDTIKMVKLTMDTFGGIDILINNAGIFPEHNFLDLTYSDWKKVMAVNLDGPFLCIKAVVPHMVKQSKGKIINISTECFFMGFETLVDYTASKAGVVGLTRGLARALGPYNINVNTITPGLTASPILKEQQPQNFAPHVEGQCIKRIQEPEDIVGTAIFLASSDSDMITGQIINVDGGYNFN